MKNSRKQKDPLRSGSWVVSQVHLPAEHMTTVSLKCVTISNSSSAKFILSCKIFKFKEQETHFHSFSYHQLPTRVLILQFDRINYWNPHRTFCFLLSGTDPHTLIKGQRRHLYASMSDTEPCASAPSPAQSQPSASPGTRQAPSGFPPPQPISATRNSSSTGTS